jgi:ferredoxin
VEKKDETVGAALVVGGGIGGVQAALDLAESGYYVYLLEKSPAIGGVMAQLDKTFPTNDCSMCILSPKLVEAGRHLNIRLITNAELKEVSGEPGRFKVKILKKPRYIDMDKCTGCGLCAQSDLTELREVENEIWVDRIKIDESRCIQCGDCVQACLEENQERQGLTNIALERQRFIELPPEERDGKVADTLWQQIALMDVASRAEFWQRELSKCIKCYGCRDVCPVCICDECELEDPEWITPGRIPPEFPLFHVIRAYHVADSCINCGECEATCPMNIPLRTIQQLIWRQPPERVFEFVPGLDSGVKERLIEQAKERPIAKRGVRR